MERDGVLNRKMKQETSMKQAANKASFMFVPCLSYSSALNVEAI
jgi:hypothetical protein